MNKLRRLCPVLPLQIPHRREGDLDLVGQPDVVLIAEHDIGGIGVLQKQTEIAARAEVLPFARDDHDCVGMPGTIVLENLAGPVRRAVVTYQQPPPTAGLGQEGIQLLGQIGSAVEGREQNVDGAAHLLSAGI